MDSIQVDKVLIAKLMKENILLRLRLAASKMGVTELSKKCGISGPHLHKILREDGNPQLQTLSKIVDALGFKIELHGVEEPVDVIGVIQDGTAKPPTASFGTDNPNVGFFISTPPEPPYTVEGLAKLIRCYKISHPQKVWMMVADDLVMGSHTWDKIAELLAQSEDPEVVAKLILDHYYPEQPK